MLRKQLNTCLIDWRANGFLGQVLPARKAERELRRKGLYGTQPRDDEDPEAFVGNLQGN